MIEQLNLQLKWPQHELDRLGTRIQSDLRNAISDHNCRIGKWRDYYRRWRAMVEEPAMGEETASNVPVPYCQWNVMTKWAKEMDSLFGDDAQIVAVPVGPSDYKKDAKIGRYMTWRVFNSMGLIKPFAAFVNRKILFGRSIAFAPWKRETFEVKNPRKNYKPEQVIAYEGPDFIDLWPDDVIVPAEEVRSIHEFSFVIRRTRVTPDELLRGELEGRYQGIKKNWDSIINLAQRGMQREFEGEEIKREKDEAEGILYQRPLSSGELLTIYEWYGRWRPLKKGPRGGMTPAAEYDFDRREMFQQDYKVTYLWDLHQVIGLQDLADLYPTMQHRRPFVESAMMADGTYWSPGLIELLLNLEDELRINYNQATEAGQMAISPPLAYRPATGFDPETFKLEPGLAIPVDNPATDIMQIQIRSDMRVAEWKEQVTLAYGEKLTGLSDLQMGRQADRPNAPRTARQTIALLEEGNVRISLDAKILREDMSKVLSHFWELEYLFSPEEVFFRVTEDDADGLFDVQDGGSILTMLDRDGRYDFKLEFASSVYSREAKKENTLARYQLDLQNPLIVQNPIALWEVTRAAHEALGDPNFEDMVPKPAQPDLPIDPRTEWTMLLEGESIHVNPLDNDMVHMARHLRDIKTAEANPNGPGADPDAMTRLILHYHDHIAQLQAKKIAQAIMEKSVAAAGGMGGAGGPLAFPNGLFGNPPSQPEGNPAATGPFIYSGHPEVGHEQ